MEKKKILVTGAVIVVLALMSISLVSSASEKSVLNRITKVFVTNKDPINVAFNGTASKTIILADGAYMEVGDVWEGYHNIDVEGYRKATVYLHVYFHTSSGPVDLDASLEVNYNIPLENIWLYSESMWADTSSSGANRATITSDVIGPNLNIDVRESDYKDWKRTYYLAVYLTN